MDIEKQEFQPAYDFDSSESCIRLSTGTAEIIIDGVPYSCDGEVHLDFLPRPRIYLYGKCNEALTDALSMVITDQKKISSYSFNGKQIDGFVSSIKDNVYKWVPHSEPINGLGDESIKMTRVVFHLFNFVGFFGTRRSIAKKKTTYYAIEHVDFTSENWNVELKSLTSTRENLIKLKAEGGYQLTHIGEMKKTDETLFSGKDAAEYLNTLRFFFSFAMGCWCNPICAVGFDSSNNCVWESWSSPADTQHTQLSWFDPHHSSQLTTLFPGFISKWVDKKWNKTLHDCLYWYLQANQSERGIDIGIILCQTAIELLSYEFVVNDRQLLSAKGFKDLWASDKFRLLFSSLGIPLAIPDDCSKLKKLVSNNKQKWLDAPHVLTEIRNSLVHPDHKLCELNLNEYYETWNLSLWYLEMSILAICGYSEDYGNRLKQHWIGEIKNVPWK